MPGILAQLDDGGVWLAAVVGGLVALGWLIRKTFRGYRKLNDFLRKADVILDIAEYELQHNGGGSIKDSVSKIPALLLDVAVLKQDVAELKQGDKVLREGAGVIAERAADLSKALAEHVDQANGIHEEQAAAIAHLADALPIVARSTPHPDDAA